ncbi:Mob1/phocein [Neohortaea acidophila]|uniref:Mob1/phocein n=1 Tax=Neohortaea acidophila TaxID=245834 RepID=A0A6A6Q3F7_9PEZI|nr:Mob1/phocein [Neohortaea acidophila]KAF2486812.1 Mob1/phocein [Neohortaea acidophila]
MPLFFRGEYAGFIVKGNFMTLAAKPHLVEEGEWLAHQIVEQNRLLSGMLRCVQEKDRTTGRPTCNEHSCPSMSAGPTTYTWIDTKGNPINLPAPTYIKHIQTWVSGKVQDQALFPTDNFTTAPPLPRASDVKADPAHYLGRTSGFPQRFESEVKNMYKQMLRCYAHLYWQHWLVFWELGGHRELNTCFVHFMNVGRAYRLLGEKDIEPMAPLVDLWIKEGVLPKYEEEGGSVASPTSVPERGASTVVGPTSGAGVGNAGTAAAWSD